MTVLSYLYKIFSRILFIISLIITIEIIVFSQSTFMEYAEGALPYILISDCPALYNGINFKEG